MTATADRPLKHFCMEDLKSADLTGISLIPQPLTLRLDFTFGTGIYDTAIEFYQLVHQVISQPVNSDSEESCFWVGNAELRQLTEDKSQILSALSYPFQNQEGLIETGSSTMFYFRLEVVGCVARNNLQIKSTISQRRTARVSQVRRHLISCPVDYYNIRRLG